MTIANITALHRLQAERLGQRIALRFRRHGLFQDWTWTRYRDQALAAAAALVAAGIQPGDRVGLLSENRAEWLVADLAILATGAINVPVHAPMTAQQAQFQFHDAGAVWLFVSNECQLSKIRAVRNELPNVRGVIVFEPTTGDDAVSWRGFLQHGRDLLPSHQDELARRESRLGRDDLATIMYTSGTTGNPKGVMLTHGNLLSNVEGFHENADCGFDSVFLNWLPFSHIYARTVDHYHHLWTGSLLCLAKSAETLVDDLKDIQPTHMSSVPRFYEKVLTASASADPKETARKLKKVFGHRIDWLGSGGAPLPPAVAQAYHAAGILLLQGYGLTESSPVISFNRKDRYKIESVGPALPNVEIKIGADGELLSRGPHIMKGYWNNPSATADAIEEGWLHTGDLARIDEEGFLYITGRKKELIVLSNGKKVLPAVVEGLLLGDSCIDQVVIYGEGRNFLTALIVPHWANLRQAMSNPPSGTEESLTEHPAVQTELTRRVEAALKCVAPWEQIRKFIVVPHPFSVAADELTVSLKLKRNVIFGRYREGLEKLYE